MDATAMRGKTPDELRTALVALKKESFNLRFQQATGQMENTPRLRFVRALMVNDHPDRPRADLRRVVIYRSAFRHTIMLT